MPPELRLVHRGHGRLDIAGSEALTRTLWGASRCEDLVNWWTAALDALYAGCRCGRLTIIAEIEPMLMAVPPPFLDHAPPHDLGAVPEPVDVYVEDFVPLF